MAGSCATALLVLQCAVHELSIASAVLDGVAAEAARHPGARVKKVGVRVGEISGVDCDALSFGFEALAKGSEWESLTLQIELCPRVQRCCSCSHQFRAPDSETACPECGSAESTCVAGQEIEFAFLELEE